MRPEIQWSKPTWVKHVCEKCEAWFLHLWSQAQCSWSYHERKASWHDGRDYSFFRTSDQKKIIIRCIVVYQLPWWTPNMFADKTTHSDLRLRMPTATQLIMRSKVFVCLVCLLKPWNLPIYCIRKPIQWPHSYLQLSGSNKGVIPSGVLAWSSGTPLGKEPQWHALGQIQKTLDTAATMGESSSQVTGRGMGWDTSPCRASWSVRRPRVPRSNPELELEVEKSSS